MTNAEVYEAAKQNILSRREEIGYALFETDCWGMAKEFEYEWHRQNGGQSKIDIMFPFAPTHDIWDKKITDGTIDLEQSIHTANWRHIDPTEEDFENGDCAITAVVDGLRKIFSVWFFCDGVWEISDNGDDAFKSISNYKIFKSFCEVKCVLRKKAWSEKTKVLGTIGNKE